MKNAYRYLIKNKERICLLCKTDEEVSDRHRGRKAGWCYFCIVDIVNRKGD